MMIARMAIDPTPTPTTQPPLSLAQGLLQRANLARQLLSPWAQAQLAATTTSALPSTPPHPLPTLAQRIAQRFTRNDDLVVRHDRRLFRFAAAPQPPLPLARPFVPAQVNPTAVDDALEPAVIADVEPSRWSSPDAVETTAALSQRLSMGRSSIATEITERIRRATMETAAPQQLTAASATAPQPPFTDDEMTPVLPPATATEDDLEQADLTQQNYSIAALIRERIQRAEADRLAPNQPVVEKEAAQSPLTPAEQTLPPTASVAALLRERIQRAQAERFTPQTEMTVEADANQPKSQPPTMSRPLSPPTFPVQTAPALPGAAWSPSETTAQTDEASSVLPTARLPDLSSGRTAPVFIEELPPQVRRMRAYSRVDLVATGVNRPLPQAEPAAAFADPTAPLPDVDEQTLPPSVAAPVTAPDEPLPTAQRTKAVATPVTPQPPPLPPLVAQAPTPVMTTLSRAPDDQPAVARQATTKETTAELPVAPGTSSASLSAEHESPVLQTGGTTADRAAVPPTVSTVSTSAMAPAPTLAPPARPMAEATMQRQSATIAAAASSFVASITGASTQLAPENATATATQEGRESFSGKVVPDELVDMTDLPGRLFGQPWRSPVNPNTDEPALVPTATLPSARLPVVLTTLIPMALPAASSPEPSGPPNSDDQPHPLDNAPVDQAINSSTFLTQSARLPAAALAETSPMPTAQTGERNLTPAADNGEAIAASPQTAVTAPALPPLAVTQRMAQARRVQRQSLRPDALPSSTLTAVQQTEATTVDAPGRTIDCMGTGEPGTPPPPMMGDALPLVGPIDQRKIAVATDAITTRQAPVPVAMRQPHFAAPAVPTSLPADDDWEPSPFAMPGTHAADDQGGPVTAAPLPAPGIKPLVQRRINPALAALLPAAEPVVASAAELITNQLTAPSSRNRAEPPDLDTLARQVYPLIKRMLAIERERHPFA